MGLVAAFLAGSSLVLAAPEPAPARSAGGAVKGASPATDGSRVLQADSFKHYVASFNQSDRDTVAVNPLLPEDTWDFFCLDGVPYHGRLLTILWDRTGERYQKGKGLRVFADGREIAASATLGRITGTLPKIPAERRSSRESGQ